MKYLILLLLLSTVSFGCKKESGTAPIEQYPSPTNVGANKLVCKINGVTEIFSGIPSYLHDIGVGFDQTTFPSPDTTKLFNINADKSSKYHYSSMSFFVNEGVPKVNIRYKITNYLPYSRRSMYNIDSFKANKFYYLNEDKVAFIQFSRYDDNVVSGTFEFYGINREDSTDKVEITDGWFDISRDH